MSANPTLESIKCLCKSGGVKSVITYNYDNLLEIALGDLPYQSIWKNQKVEKNKLPIYHVHGYIPFDSTRGSKSNEIIFTEDQYHRVAHDPYYWSNLVQIKNLTSTVGLMIGLSLSDKNMRRLLDAINKAPVDNINYALLQKPKLERPEEDELTKIDTNARKHIKLFEHSGIKKVLEKKD